MRTPCLIEVHLQESSFLCKGGSPVRKRIIISIKFQIKNPTTMGYLNLDNNFEDKNKYKKGNPKNLDTLIVSKNG